uniref:Uncharacterized protein n=1 Tax=uncultured prokaryote TaxID=198431 RepID=A0A0H5Q4W2_9ZZZZ|nr:hypothetical protein [uncultured prokaryote]
MGKTMKFGDIELAYLGNKQVVAVWGRERLLPGSLVDCEQGTLTAAEYVALHAVRTGRGGSAAVAIFCSHLDDLGEIESARTVALH